MFEMSSGQLSAIVLVIDTEILAAHKDVLDSFSGVQVSLNHCLLVDNYRNCVVSGQWFEHAYYVLSMRRER